MLRGKDDGEKVIELLAYLDDGAFQFYFKKIMINGVISNAGKDFVQMQNAFSARFSKNMEPQHVIKEATETTIDEKDVLISFDHLDSLYIRAAFDCKAKFGFYRLLLQRFRQGLHLPFIEAFSAMFNFAKQSGTFTVKQEHFSRQR